MSKTIIQTNNLVKTYNDTNVVDNINLNIKEGEIYGILGPNGAGKTTLIKMLSTIIKTTSGNATIYGYDLKKDATKIKSLIGVTGQYATIDKELTAFENLMIFGRLNGLSKADSKKRAFELLEQFSLTDVRNNLVKTYSGGMRRRIDLAISLITKPRIIFLDEPTTGLDPRTRGEMWDVIRNLVKDGSTIVLTTQYLDEADQLADNIAIIDQGKMVLQGTPEQLKAKVGETYFEIKLINSHDISSVKKTIQEHTDVDIICSAEQNNIAIKLSDVKIMSNILTDLNNQNIAIAEFSIRKPTLDEVFLQFTGKRSEDE